LISGDLTHKAPFVSNIISHEPKANVGKDFLLFFDIGAEKETSSV